MWIFRSFFEKFAVRSNFCRNCPVTLPNTPQSNVTTAEYNEAVELYADRLYRFVLKQVRDEDKAKDLVQDTFEKLWINHQDVNGAKARSWMFTTAYRTMIDQIRREKKQGDMEEADPLSMSHDRQYSDLQEILHDKIYLDASNEVRIAGDAQADSDAPVLDLSDL